MRQPSLCPRVNDAAAFGHVAVLFGGQSAERSVSLKSGQAVLAALLRSGVAASGIDVGTNPVARLQQESFDRAFIVLHGKGGEDGVIQAQLQGLGIPYTGSGVMGSALAMNKLASKRLWLGCHLPTPEFVILDGRSESAKAAEKLGMPLIVKPVDEGSSIGMTKVNAVAELHAAWEAAGGENRVVMAERWVDGAEYTVAIVAGQALPLIKIETPHVFYDFAAKYEADTTKYICPCGLPAEQEQELQTLALTAFDVMGCQGWGRVDLLVDAADSPWLIEVNTVPGMTDHSLVPMAAQTAGMDFDALVWRVLETSLVEAAL
jgi:D-alanine-D-alanine ligase